MPLSVLLVGCLSCVDFTKRKKRHLLDTKISCIAPTGLSNPKDGRNHDPECTNNFKVVKLISHSTGREKRLANPSPLYLH
jgi:hypothetical protein